MRNRKKHNGEFTMRKIGSLIVVAIIMACLGVYAFMDDKNSKSASAVQNAEDFKPKANFAAPVNQLPDLFDDNQSFGGAQEKLQLVNFWASWCGPCELEAPDLQKLHENYSDVLTLYGVNSTKYDREREARKFVDDYSFTFDILFDREGDITNLYRVSTYPTSFLIDHEGIIRERINGVITYEEWERIIKKWL